MSHFLKANTLVFAVLVSLLAMLATAPQCRAQNYSTTQSAGASIVPGTTDIGNHCDDCTTTITLPFTYQLYGTYFTTADVSSNGNIQFNSTAADYSNIALPAGVFSYTIFTYWDDLYTSDDASGQGIFTSISGVAPNRIFNIEWRTEHCCNTGVPVNNFEIRLYEGPQKFDVIYGSLSDNGASATTGVQQDDSNFTEYSFDTSDSVSSGQQVTYNFAPTAADVSISGRVLAPGRRGLRNALVAITGADGVSRQAVTNSFGYFQFGDLTAGQTYVIGVVSKRFVYTPQAVYLTQSITDLTLLPSP